MTQQTYPHQTNWPQNGVIELDPRNIHSKDESLHNSIATERLGIIGKSLDHIKEAIASQNGVQMINTAPMFMASQSWLGKTNEGTPDIMSSSVVSSSEVVPHLVTSEGVDRLAASTTQTDVALVTSEGPDAIGSAISSDGDLERKLSELYDQNIPIDSKKLTQFPDIARPTAFGKQVSDIENARDKIAGMFK